MPEPITWGQLPKSQIDPERIEEAIARMIKEHNEDESAHLGPGQSLQSHKASEIIDHAVASIIADKIRDGEISLEKFVASKFFFLCSFESLDGWMISGTVLQRPGSARLETSATSGSYSVLSALPYSWSGLVWSKNFFWQSTIKLHQKTNQYAQFGVGAFYPGEGLSFVGFKVVDAKLYAYLWGYTNNKTTERQVEISGVDITQFHVYRVIYNASTGEIKFYVDGALKATIIKDFYLSDDDDFTCFYIETHEAAKKYLTAIDVLFSRDR